MKKVGIIGAGVAGLTASYKLKNAGFQVDLYEAADSLGGRSKSFFDKTIGHEIDNGTHLMVGAYSEFFDLLKYTENYDKLNPQKSLQVKYLFQDAQSDILNAGKLPGDFGLLLGLMNIKYLNTSEKLSLLNTAIKIKLNGFSGITDLNCLEFLKNIGQSDRLIEFFWEPIILATINSPIKEASAELLINVMRLSFFASSKLGSLYFPKVPLSRLLDGFEENFKANSSNQIYNSTPVQMIDGRKILSKNGKLEYDDIIIATNLKESKKLVTKSNLDIILPEIESSSIVSVYLKYERDIIEEEFFAMIGSKSQWFFNKTKLFELDTIEGIYSIVISASDNLLNLRDNELIELTNNELKNSLPQLNEINFLSGKVIREKNATLNFTPESNKLRPKNFTNNENIFLAGDWTDTGLPCTLEGAARSGKEAANLIIKKYD